MKKETRQKLITGGLTFALLGAVVIVGMRGPGTSPPSSQNTQQVEQIENC